MKDLIVVGGAAAGMTAAVYGVRSGLDVEIVTDEYGGQINNTDVVENYMGFKSISGPELVQNWLEHMRDYDIDETTGEKVVEITKNDDIFSLELENGQEKKAYSVVIATGGSRRKLGVEGEEKFQNKGVGYCAVCDGPLYQDEEVAVIGGGYAGTEAAAYLSDIASKVYVIDRSDGLSGEEITKQKAKEAENVEVIKNAEVEKFYGDNMLEGLKYTQNDKIKDLKVTGAFVEIGTEPNSNITDLVETQEGGCIKVDEYMKTKTEGLYAAGDVNCRGIQQLAVSSGQGSIAALQAAEYVKEVKK